MSSQQGYTCLIDLFLPFSAVPLGLEWGWGGATPHSQCVQSTTKERKTVSERERELQPITAVSQAGSPAAPVINDDRVWSSSSISRQVHSNSWGWQPEPEKEWERESIRSPLPPRLFYLGCLSLFRSCLLSLFTYTLFFPWLLSCCLFDYVSLM